MPTGTTSFGHFFETRFNMLNRCGADRYKITARIINYGRLKSFFFFFRCLWTRRKTPHQSAESAVVGNWRKNVETLGRAIRPSIRSVSAGDATVRIDSLPRSGAKWAHFWNAVHTLTHNRLLIDSIRDLYTRLKHLLCRFAFVFNIPRRLWPFNWILCSIICR